MMHFKTMFFGWLGLLLSLTSFAYLPSIGSGTYVSPPDCSFVPDKIDNMIYLGEYNNSKYYCSDTDKYTWKQAKAAAESHGGHLIIVDDLAENEFIKNNILADYVWIGLTDESSEGKFKTVLGDEASYFNWALEEPNNSNGEEHYVRLLRSNGQWTDRTQSFQAEYIMEIPCPNVGDQLGGEVCTTRTAENVVNCKNDRTYGGWLKIEDQDYYYAVSNSELVEYADGTAVLTGTWINNENNNLAFDFEINLTGRTDVAPNDPKTHSCLSPDYSTFYYYEDFTGVITGKHLMEGAIIHISSYGAAAQFGIGANATGTANTFGASAWFKGFLVQQPTNGNTIKFDAETNSHLGDINIKLSGKVDDCENCDDADEDGLCDYEDCAPNDPNLPTDPGTSCNDNNVNTINDVIQEDGCSCRGIIPPCTISVKVDTRDDITICEGREMFLNTIITDAAICNTDHSYKWSGPDTETATPKIIVSTPGTFCVTVTDCQGCTASSCVTLNLCNPCEELGGDTDEDGVCDNEDCAPNDPNLPTDPGTTCDDNNVNTINDVIQDDGCSCKGIVPPCTVSVKVDNGDDFTICEGGEMSLNAIIAEAASCNPNNSYKWSGPRTETATTSNITVSTPGTYCVTVTDCQGCTASSCVTLSLCDPCEELGGDSDKDGVCDNEDCAPNDPNLPTDPGTACDDNNGITINDVIQDDGCSCKGIVPPCTVSVKVDNGDDFTICEGGEMSLNAIIAEAASCNPNNSYKWSGPRTETATTSNITVSTPGTYCVTVTDCQGCTASSCVTLSLCDPCEELGGDSDKDGVCDNEDCAPNDPNLPTDPGTACDDNNGITINDVIQDDGCSCKGIVPPCTVSVKVDNGDDFTICEGEEMSLNAIIADAASCNPNNSYKWSGPRTETATTSNITVSTPGTYCVTVTDCQGCTASSCVTLSLCDPCEELGGDSDKDGVCDNEDCAPNDPNLPTDPGTACDDNNGITINDVIQDDGCSCKGIVPPCELTVNIGDDFTFCEGDNAAITALIENAETCIPDDCIATTLVTYNGACDDPSDCLLPSGIASCLTNVSGICPTNDSGPYASCNNNIICIASMHNDWDFSMMAENTFEFQQIEADFWYPTDGSDAGGTANDSSCPTSYNATVQFYVNGILHAEKSVNVVANQIFTKVITPDAPILVESGSTLKIVIDGQPISEDCDLFELAGLRINGCCNPQSPSPEQKNTYSWDGPDIRSETGPTIIASSVGTYCVTVTDCNGCVASDCVAIAACVPCENQGGDSDGDGICDNNDCAPNNSDLPQVAGTVCDDNNPNTINDLIQDDGCTCIGSEFPNISINDLTVNEEDGTATLEICIDQIISEDVSVNFETENEDALQDEDYVANNDLATILGGQTCIEISFEIIDDENPEDTEEFVVNLSNPTNGIITDPEGKVTILDTDETPPVPNISINDVTVNEEDGAATLQICIDQVSFDDVSVNFATADTDASEGKDYISNNSLAIIPAGQTCIEFSFEIIDDEIPEDTEDFVVNLTGPTNGNISDSEGMVTILDTDSPVLNISINDVTVNEEDGTATLEICIDQVTSLDVSVNFATENEDALQGEDYVDNNGLAIIPVGQTCVEISFELVDDENAEDTEEFVVNLTNPTNGIINDAEGKVTILDSDDSNLPASIRGKVWEDINKNGIQDSDEPSIKDAIINIVGMQNSGMPITESMLSGADGSYAFNDLVPGTYVIEFDSPDGYTPTLANVGNNDVLDSDSNNGSSDNITVDWNDNIGNIDAGFFLNCDNFITEFVMPNLICQGASVELAALPVGTNTSYSWSFFNGPTINSTFIGSQTGHMVNISFSSAGGKLVRLHIENDDCETDIDQVITIVSTNDPVCTTCDNVADGGQIGSNQSGCSPFNPKELTNVTSPFGGSGTVVYRWLKSTSGITPQSVDDSNWSTIPDANQSAYDPGPITETTYYVRYSKHSDCVDWAGISNIVKKEVLGENISVGFEVLSDPICAASLIDMVAFDAGPDASYEWFFFNGPSTNSTYMGNRSGQQVGFTYFSSGKKLVRLSVVNSDGCAAVTDQLITILEEDDPACAEGMNQSSFNLQLSLNGSDEVILDWGALNEPIDAAYEIEYSADGIVFDIIGTSSGNGIESENVMLYQFLDDAPSFGINYYRIKQILSDGSFRYSNIKNITISFTNGNTAIVFPNPAGDVTTLMFSSPVDKTINLEITNSQGAIVQKFTMTAGMDKVQIDLSNLPTGYYFIYSNEGGLRKLLNKVLKMEN